MNSLDRLVLKDERSGGYVSITPDVPDGRHAFIIDQFGRIRKRDGTVVGDGADGLSAYEIAVENGFEGTEEEWLDSMTSGASTITIEEPSVIPLAGIDAGTTFDKVTPEDFVKMLLYPELNPTLTSPSLSFVANRTVFCIGDESSVTLTATFNRGTISPAYGTSGYRAGNIVSIIINGAMVPVNNLKATSTVRLDTSALITDYVSCSCSYAMGEQPLTSEGNNFSTPLPAGNISKEVMVHIVAPYFATTESISVADEQPLIKVTNYMEVAMVGEDNTGRQSIEYNQTLGACTGIEVYNTFSKAWEWVGGSKAKSLSTFTKTELNKTINGITLPYLRYEYNGAGIGSRQLRFYIN